MKKLTVILLSAVLALSLAACSSTNQPISSTTQPETSAPTEQPATEPSESSSTAPAESEPETQPKTGKTLVVYYSASGNTERVAKDIAEAADGDTEDVALQSSEEDTETPETSEGLSSDSQEDTFGDGEESFGDASDSGESGIEYIKGRPLTEEEEQEQLAPFDNLTS